MNLIFFSSFKNLVELKLDENKQITYLEILFQISQQLIHLDLSFNSKIRNFNFNNIKFESLISIGLAGLELKQFRIIKNFKLQDLDLMKIKLNGLTAVENSLTSLKLRRNKLTSKCNSELSKLKNLSYI